MHAARTVSPRVRRWRVIGEKVRRSGKVTTSPSLSHACNACCAHRMAVGLEVQSEKVEGDRLGDYVTFCRGSPGPT